MYYSYELLCRKSNGKFATIWLLSNGRKVPNREVMKIRISNTVKDIQKIILTQHPDHLPGAVGKRFSLYLAAKLIHGVMIAEGIQLKLFIVELRNCLRPRPPVLEEPEPRRKHEITTGGTGKSQVKRYRTPGEKEQTVGDFNIEDLLLEDMGIDIVHHLEVNGAVVRAVEEQITLREEVVPGEVPEEEDVGFGETSALDRERLLDPTAEDVAPVEPAISPLETAPAAEAEQPTAPELLPSLAAPVPTPVSASPQPPLEIPSLSSPEAPPKPASEAPPKPASEASPPPLPEARPSPPPKEPPSPTPEVPPSAPPEVPPSSTPEVPPSAPPGVPPSPTPEVPPPAPPKEPPSAPPKEPPLPTPEVPPSAPPEVPPSPTPEVPPSAQPEVPPSPTPEVPPSAQPEVPPSPTPEVPPSAPPKEPPSPTPEVPPSAQPEVPPSPTPEVPPSAPPKEPPSPTPEVPPSAPPEVSPEIQAEALPQPLPEVLPETLPQLPPEAPTVPAPEMLLPIAPQPVVPLETSQQPSSPFLPDTSLVLEKDIEPVSPQRRQRRRKTLRDLVTMLPREVMIDQMESKTNTMRAMSAIQDRVNIADIRYKVPGPELLRTLRHKTLPAGLQSLFTRHMVTTAMEEEKSDERPDGTPAQLSVLKTSDPSVTPSRTDIAAPLETIAEGAVEPEQEQQLIPDKTIEVETIPKGPEIIEPATRESVIEPRDVIEPTTEVRQPTAEEQVEHAEEHVGPAEESVQPAEESVQPAEKSVQPAEESVQPAEESVQPAEESVQPAEEPRQIPEEIEAVEEEIRKPTRSEQDDMSQKLQVLWDEGVQVTFTDICPPSENDEVSAMKTFELLLYMQDENLLKLEQDLTCWPSVLPRPPIFIRMCQ